MSAIPRHPRTTDGFVFSQFLVLLRAIRKGENDADALGFSSSATGASSKRLARLRKMPPVARKALQALLLAALSVCFFFLGVGFAPSSVSDVFRLLTGTLVVLTLLTGVYWAANLLYFSRDNAYYLTLPVSPMTLMWAKIANYLAQAALSCLFLLPMGYGALWVRSAPVFVWVLLTVAFLLATLIVWLVIGALTMVLMRFSRFARDKDRFSRAFGVIAMVGGVSLGVGIQLVGNGADSTGLAAVATGILARGPIAIALGVLCVPALLADLLFSPAPLEVALGLAGSALALAAWCLVISVLAGRWYLEGMRGFTGSGGRHSSRVFDESELRGLTSARSDLAAHLSRDWKLMVRTPFFFNQFVLGPLLFPVYLASVFFVAACVNMSSRGVDPAVLLEQAGSFFSTLTFGSPALTVAALVLLGLRVLMGAGSYATTLAVSRDGADFFYLRALPVRWRSYLASKLLTSAHGDVLFLAFIAVALLVARVPLVSTAYLLALLVASSVSLALFSIAQGALFPRLHWESEAQLLKGGSAFVLVYITMIVGAVVCALPALVLACPLVFQVDLAPELALLGALGVQLLVLAGLSWLVFVVAARSLARREP